MDTIQVEAEQVHRVDEDHGHHLADHAVRRDDQALLHGKVEACQVHGENILARLLGAVDAAERAQGLCAAALEALRGERGRQLQ